MAKETSHYLCDVYIEFRPKTLAHGAQEPSWYGKRDLLAWQMSPPSTAKETY